MCNRGFLGGVGIQYRIGRASLLILGIPYGVDGRIHIK